MSLLNTPRFKIGTKFKTRHKNARLCTIVDIHKTYNHNNELVKFCYVSEHDFLGQKIKDYNVNETTISMGLIEKEES